MPIGRLGFASVILLWLVPMAVLAAPARREPWSRYGRAFERADSLLWAGETATGLAVLDSLRRNAIAAGDARRRDAADVLHATGEINARRFDAAEREVRTALQSSRARRDTVLWSQAAIVLGRTFQLRERIPEADAQYRTALSLALAARLPGQEGWARRAMAHNLHRAGRDEDACAQFRKALAAFARAGDPYGAMWCHQGLAESLDALGRPDAARAEYSRARDQARVLGDRFLEARTLKSLADIEYWFGDPSLAAERYRQSFVMARQLGRTDWAVVSANDLATLYMQAGRLDLADSVLTSVLPVVERAPVRVGRGRILLLLGRLRREQGRFDEAIEYGRRALALSDSMYAVTGVDALQSLAQSLRAAGRTASAESLLRVASERVAAGADPEVRAPLVHLRAVLLRELGRPREALALLGPAMRDTADVAGLAGLSVLDDMSEIARGQWALGDRDSALMWFRRTERGWNRTRQVTSDPEWRERIDEVGRGFAGAYAAALLDPRSGGTAGTRLRDAFALLQRVRARTLLERTRGPEAKAAGVDRTDPLQRLQRQVLAPGELFLDVYATPETSFVFAVTRDTARVWGVPPARRLVPRLRRLRDLLASTDGASAGPRASAAAQLGRDLFGPGADLIGPAGTVMIAAGSLAQYPLALLVPPGARAALLADHDVALVPSAALLGSIRSRPARPVRATSMLAIARTVDDRGRALPGVASEAQWLRRRFTRAEVRVDGAIGPIPALAGQVGRYDVLHFSAHTRTPLWQPWRSGLFLGAANDDGGFLIASDVARFNVTARLCVLAGCTTLGGRDAVGETLDGLATAWLAAGASTVIATQWAADDEATALLVRRFYDSIAAGATAAGALRDAQREVRAQPRFAHPFFWSGVVLVGEPGTRVEGLVSAR